MLNVWALHLHNCSSSSSLTSYISYIRDSTYILTTQTNLYKLNYFIYWIHMFHTYNSRPYTILIYLTVTYLCYCLSVSLCVHVYHFSTLFSTLWSLSPPLSLVAHSAYLTYFISYLYRIYECWYYSSGYPVISGEG